jgi:glycosyltransferase involved in cell wall biosynthesis
LSTASWPSVTAIVATRDRPVLLRRALTAIMGQDYPGRIDCVVVFDQSEPHELDVEVPDNRGLTTISNQRTPGLPGGRNTGILTTRSDLVAFCDDDDEWLPTKISSQVRLLAEHPESPVASCGILVHFQDRDRPRLAPDEPLGYDDFLRSRVMEVHPSTLLIRRDRLDEIGLVDEEIPGGYGEDYEWLLRSARVGPVVSVPEALTRVYWHTSSFFFDRWRTIASALEYLLIKHPEFNREPLGLARLQGQMAFAHAGMGNRSEARALAREALRANPRDRRALAALVASSGVVQAETISKVAHHFGRGV